MSIFTNLWSWSFLAGLVAGFVLNRSIALAHTCWLDRHRPLANGRKRSKWKALSFDRRWLVGLMAVAFLGWSVIATRGFFNRAGEVNRQIDAIHNEPDQNERDRPKSRPALPDPSCSNGD